MPLITLESLSISPALLIDMPNIILAATEYRRKMKVLKLEFNPAQKIVKVDTVIDLFDLNGEPIDYSVNNYAKPVNYSVNATNNAVCDATTGEHICYMNELGDDTLEQSPAYGKAYMYSFDFFFAMAATSPVVINATITQFLMPHILAGDCD